MELQQRSLCTNNNITAAATLATAAKAEFVHSGLKNRNIHFYLRKTTNAFFEEKNLKVANKKGDVKEYIFNKTSIWTPFLLHNLCILGLLCLLVLLLRSYS